MQLFDEVTLTPSGDGSTFSCLLQAGQAVSITGFKVMQNLTSEGLVPVYRSSLNGQTRLVYDTSSLTPLSSLAVSLTPPQFVTTASGLLQSFRKLAANGFIRMENLMLTPELILLDSAMTPHLIYLPLEDSSHATAQLNGAELALRRMLISFIEANPNVRSERIAHLHTALRDPHASLDSAALLLQDAAEPPHSTAPQPAAAKAADSLTLLPAVKNSVPVLTIPADGAVIGRDPARSTVLVPDSAISGIHCRIVLAENNWQLEDLGSRNGTRVNGCPAVPHTVVPLHPGDTVQLANHIYTVKA